MVGADVGADTGHTGLGGKLGSLGFQHDLKIHQTAAVALTRQKCCISRCLGGALQAQQPLAVAT